MGGGCRRESGERGGGPQDVSYVPILSHKCRGLTIWQKGLAVLRAAAGCDPPAAMAEEARAETILRGRLDVVEGAIKTKITELEQLQARASNIRALIKQELSGLFIGSRCLSRSYLLSLKRILSSTDLLSFPHTTHGECFKI
jgi:hypothetical protein